MEDKVICCCFNVTLNDMKKAINNGTKNFKEFQEKTNISTECPPCYEENSRLFDDMIKEHIEMK